MSISVDFSPRGTLQKLFGGRLKAMNSTKVRNWCLIYRRRKDLGKADLSKILIENIKTEEEMPGTAPTKLDRLGRRARRLNRPQQATGT